MSLSGRNLTFEVLDGDFRNKSFVDNNFPSLCSALQYQTGRSFSYKGFKNLYCHENYKKFVILVSDGVTTKRITNDSYFNLTRADFDIKTTADNFIAGLRVVGFAI